MNLAIIEGNLFDEPVDWVPEVGCVAPACLDVKHMNNTLVSLAEKASATFNWELPYAVEGIRDRGALDYEYSDRREVKEFINNALARLEEPMALVWTDVGDLYLKEAA